MIRQGRVPHHKGDNSSWVLFKNNLLHDISTSKSLFQKKKSTRVEKGFGDD